MAIYKTAIMKPVTTALIFVAVIIIGVFSYLGLPVDQFPEMEPPYISVMTTYPGANPSEIETNVSKILENSLNSVEGLKEISSTSKDNMSLVTLEFEWGYDLDEAVNDIRSSIDMVYDNLPDGVSRPLIFKFNTSMMPIMQYAITAQESYPGLEKILDDNVINVLNRIDGIGNLSLSGAPKRYVYIDLDPQKLQAYNLSVEQVGSAVSGNNLNLASGSVKMGLEQYQLRVQSEYVESSEINDIVVSTINGKQVHVSDLAIVRDTIKDVTIDEKISGKEVGMGRDGVRLIVMKQSGANTVQICKDVKEQLAEIQKRLPPDIKFQEIYDSSSEIENAINGLTESVMYALIFVVLVVLFFLGKWRAAIIISVTIPISLLVAFVYLKMVDSSLNIISLCSLNVAIGMVVDDAIVVLENITKQIERGARPREAAIYATNEVWVSVIATTLVIVAVFVPLTMLTGQAGILFKELGWIVTIVCCTSTVVAISLTPMLCSKLLKARAIRVSEDGKIVDEEEKKQGWYAKYILKFLDKVDRVYANMLRWCLGHKTVTIISVIALFVLSLIPAYMGFIGTDFMKQQDNGRMSVTVEFQRGTRVEESMRLLRELETKFCVAAPEIQLISTSVGSDDESSIGALFGSANNSKASITIRCPKKYERERTIWQIAEDVRGVLNATPEVVDYTVSTSTGMGGSSNTVDVEIMGYDFDKTNMLAETYKNKFKSIAGARDINIDREEDRAEIQLIFDKEKLARHGLSTANVAMYVRNRVYGMTAGYLKEDGEEYDIVVRIKEEFRDELSEIENLVLTDAYGKQVKVSELAEVREYWCPPEIKRQTRQRIVKVQVTPEGVSLGELAAEIKQVIGDVEVPDGVNVHIGGTYEDQQETFADMGLLMALIVMLVYIVMASQFESLSKPAIILTSALFAIPGVIIALWVTGYTLDMIGALGVILLVGIVVKNGIVLVDYINLMRDRGYELNEAIALSGESRLRPVLMTAFTTILGMLPMALSQSEGSEMWQSMGIVVIGGLLVSTVITLVIVPVLYAIMSRHGERDKDAQSRKEFIFMQLSDKED